jgi:hypothetical protein
MNDNEPMSKAIEIIDERIEYLENYTPRDRAHEESLERRIGELQTVKHRIESVDTTPENVSQ